MAYNKDWGFWGKSSFCEAVLEVTFPVFFGRGGIVRSEAFHIHNTNL
jgi:hypothetical protein